MIPSEDFIDDFISECIDKGIKTPNAICDVVIAEMDEIDKKLRESNLLRIKYKDLKSVLKHFDHFSLKKIDYASDSTFSEVSNLKDFSYYNILIDICNFIDNAKNHITPREVMDSVGSRENSDIIYGCIKILGDHGIITRNEDRLIFKGPKWSERPVEPIINTE
jgi:hypothetical protein